MDQKQHSGHSGCKCLKMTVEQYQANKVMYMGCNENHGNQLILFTENALPYVQC